MENPDAIGGDWRGARHHGWGTTHTGTIRCRSSAPSSPAACLQNLSKLRSLGSDRVSGCPRRALHRAGMVLVPTMGQHWDHLPEQHGWHVDSRGFRPAHPM